MNCQIFAFALSLLIAYLLTPWVRKSAIKLNIMVHPGGRRVHTRPMPLWGGIAIYAGFAVSALLLMHFTAQKPACNLPIIGVVVAGALLVTVGLVDDMKELSAKAQAGMIILSALLLMTFGVRIQFLTNPFGGNMILLPPVISWILTLSWIFAVTKTIDFMDGLDGLAAGIGAIASGVLAIMAYYSNQPHVALMAAALCGACIGFLRFNFNPAKIFMGTGGSQFIGFALGAISVIGAFKVAAAMAIALPILVFGVPIFDAAFVIFKRLSNGQPLYIADKSHLHHRLMQKGLSHKQAVYVIWGISILLGIAALAIFSYIKRGG
ncbi:MAG: MraY family glycosyltransferase [Armatimonadota bacterium]|jgi:UDP-GlcNAc:undecaprenyl-phosphate GlcNAc-1-phosphate transferase|nr:undecaprenyl-phosphate alpha-N-acetylglucosaminyl 1-phosphate transferase [Armatimonadota bacterium]